MKCFLDLEFTGLHARSTIISIGIVAENGEQFYAEMRDYDDAQVQREPFLQNEVMPKLLWQIDENQWEHTIDRARLVERLEVWLHQVYNQDGMPIQMWSDVYAYDWILFCGLWGNAMNVPSIVHYIPRDLATFLEANGYDADTDREVFAGMKDSPDMMKHNALWDAKVLKGCHDRIVTERTMAEDATPTVTEPPPGPPAPEDVPETEEPTEEQPPPEDDES